MSTLIPKGVIVPIITPFTDAGVVDWPAYDRVLEHVLQGGVDAVFVLGTTGEGPSLSEEEKRGLVKRTCEKAAGVCHVYVGVMDTSLSESLALTEYASKCGAHATVIVPSPYFPAGAREQIAFFQQFVEGSKLPVILYNIPQMTKTALAPEAFDVLLDDVRIIGLKDSSGNMVYFRRLQHIARRRPGFSMLIGAEELLAEAVLLGAAGGVTGGANVFPSLYKKLFIAARERNFEEIEKLQARVMELSCQLYSYGNGGYIIAGIKAMMHARNLSGPQVLLPLLSADSGLVQVARKLVCEESAFLD